MDNLTGWQEISTTRATRSASITRNWLLYVLLIGIAAMMVAPFLWMLITSLSNPSEAYTYPPSLPKQWRFENYGELFDRLPFGTFTFNSLKISILATLGTLFSASLAAYAFARMEFRGKRTLYWIILATMMIPFQVTMIPVFFLLKTLGFYGSHAALIVPHWFGFGMGAFGIFLLRQFFTTVPRELEEAARIDGAGSLRIFWSIMLPTARPALVTLSVLTFMAHWNDLIGPVLYLTDTDQMTLTIGLAALGGGDLIARVDLLMAGALVSLLPILVLFVVAQRFFVQGITATGIKG
ncbi:MAG: carbohydrate ABC transporter permease [Ignavibacteriae bacterium]|nr:carbohydrate ABC transporter permease [Ignavibacteriota bacterium]MCB9217404.1 carbohydrate ABC transporter permease [Ignavibacteria bacterium]